jgi:hypothetical protein
MMMGSRMGAVNGVLWMDLEDVKPDLTQTHPLCGLLDVNWMR